MTRQKSTRSATASQSIVEATQPENVYRSLDHAKESIIARMTGGISPASLYLAYIDWAMHMIGSPGKQLELNSLASKGLTSLAQATNGHIQNSCSPLMTDSRFASPSWSVWPYAQWADKFLTIEKWWDTATRDVPGLSKHHQNVVNFATRQWLDIFSPSNNPLTNPEIVQCTAEQSGKNLLCGAMNAVHDVMNWTQHNAPDTDSFTVGKNLAVTPGKVVFTNHLIELIQYSPITDLVIAEPVLIVPAAIMKYYILDLSPQNSMIRFLVSQGYTVFCISWRNIDEKDRDISLNDYQKLGVLAAMDTIGEIISDHKIHAVGYCLGGTILAITAATLAGQKDQRLASVTLLAAQTDFSEPGELHLFIDESEINFIESMMSQRGYLSAEQMSGAFQLLQSNELIWSRIVNDYMRGERAPITDLMAWNADATRLPYRMHSEYLRKLFLNNELASGRYQVDGHSISLHNIRCPLFVVSTERDHIAPWKSVYKIHELCDSAITFVLTTGGHNAGIISEPGHPQRTYKLRATEESDLHIEADAWETLAEHHEGSWWIAWIDWLKEHSNKKRIAPPPMGGKNQANRPMHTAPGTYVFQT
jgi:polyhydroxyalkanoate synthase